MPWLLDFNVPANPATDDLAGVAAGAFGIDVKTAGPVDPFAVIAGGIVAAGGLNNDPITLAILVCRLSWFLAILGCWS